MKTDNHNSTDETAPEPGLLQLGVDGDTLRLAGSDDVSAVAAELARQARRSLLLYSFDLEARIYDRREFIDAVSALVRRQPGACFDVLIQNVERVVKDGHRLVDLMRRMGSSIQIRHCAEQYRSYCGTFLLADDRGYLYRPLSSRYEGVASFNNAAEVARLGNYFREVWEHSKTNMELRRLYI